MDTGAERTQKPHKLEGKMQIVASPKLHLLPQGAEAKDDDLRGKTLIICLIIMMNPPL